MTWNPITEPVDFIVLAGKRSPGLAEVAGAGSPRLWDKRKGFGYSGAILVFRGVDLSSFSVKLRLFDEQDWADWYAWKPVVDTPPLGTRARSLDIQHPILDGLNIKSVVIDDVSQPTQTDDGVFEIEIKMTEFRAPKYALAKPEGSTATPVDPVEENIIKPLREQFQALADQ